MIGFVVVALGLSMGINCGYPINPARDFAPRLFTAMIGAAGPPGYGIDVFTGKTGTTDLVRNLNSQRMTTTSGYQ